MYKVIIVEDDLMVANINKQYVELNPAMQVLHVFSEGNEALEFFKEHDADLIIIDMYMPGINGLELLRKIRFLQRNTAVIVVTAANDSSNIRQFLDLGIIDYVMKPFEYTRFNHALAKFINYCNCFNKANYSQQDLDAILESSSTLTILEDLEKGLQTQTLDNILNFIKSQKDHFFTTEEIASKVNLSRVTVKRYIDYLVKQKKLFCNLDYATGGRPAITYRYIDFIKT